MRTATRDHNLFGSRRPIFITRSIEKAEVRTRAMNRKLRDVEALPGEEARELLGDALSGSDADEP